LAPKVHLDRFAMRVPRQAVPVCLLSGLWLGGCVSGQLGANVAPGYEEPAVVDDEGVPLPDPQRAVPASRELNLEVCDNALDDDGDGEVDEECTCATDDVRACYPGPVETLGVGVCHGGMQSCDTTFEFGTWGTCAGSVLPSVEILGNGLDDDCDGAADCMDTEMLDEPACAPPPDPCEGAVEVLDNGIDDDCDGAVDCADSDFVNDARCIEDPCAPGGVGGPQCGPPPLCPDGQTATFRKRDLGGNLWGGSSITQGDGQPETTMTCEPGGGCGAGQVAAEAANGQLVCTDPPPACAEGTFPSFTDAGTWECDPPCDLVIHYGAIFGNQTSCAENPDLQCGFGTVPTFVFESESWECRATCDNGMYDQIWFNGALMCVPC